MKEVCSVVRNENGIVIVHVEGPTSGIVRRLLIDATYNVNSFDDIDAGDVPPATKFPLPGEGFSSSEADGISEGSDSSTSESASSESVPFTASNAQLAT
ncbi:MAG: hypothetical protein ACLP9L_41600 [Thermoguttaceae bacterium]